MTQSAPTGTDSAIKKIAERQGFLRPTRIAPSPPVPPPESREMTQHGRTVSGGGSHQIPIKRTAQWHCRQQQQQQETHEHRGKKRTSATLNSDEGGLSAEQTKQQTDGGGEKENSGREEEEKVDGPPSPLAGVFSIDI